MDVQEVNRAPHIETVGEEVNSKTEPFPLVRLMVVKLQLVMLAAERERG